MRKLIIAWSAIVSMIMMYSCINLDGVNSRIDDLETRVLTLEELCREMNGDISSLKTIVSALEANDYVTSVKPVEEKGVVTGYTLTFSKSGSVTILHGKDGADGKDGLDGADGKDGADGQDGKDGAAPVIGVKQDSAGDWYWTLNGEWLLDSDGNKVRANGKDGQDGEDGKDGEPYLSCTGSSIASIDLSKNTELTEVYLSENKLTALDVSPLTRLTTLDVSPMETLQTLYVGTAQSINYITYNRNTSYIPAATAIVTK